MTGVTCGRFLRVYISVHPQTMHLRSADASSSASSHRGKRSCPIPGSATRPGRARSSISTRVSRRRFESRSSMRMIRGWYFANDSKTSADPTMPQPPNDTIHPETKTESMRAFLGGRFVVFDGPDGCGKSTQFRRFSDWAHAQGVVVTEVREPGGTDIGEQIRAILLDPRNSVMTVKCEMLLYMASRAQLLEERIRPALERGELVLADRFVSSTLAYQGTAGGITTDDIMRVARIAVGDLWPDEIVIFDVDTETAWKRMAAGRANSAPDRMELKSNEFHDRVRQGYLQQCRDDPARYVAIDARQDPETVFARLIEAFVSRMKAGIGPRVRR
ncbi:MAG: dTMP kinase [Planctomycetota bacterium]|nr:MAG: dTMP kinase [Planctomycetota bacterium]